MRDFEAKLGPSFGTELLQGMRWDAKNNRRVNAPGLSGNLVRGDGRDKRSLLGILVFNGCRNRGVVARINSHYLWSACSHTACVLLAPDGGLLQRLSFYVQHYSEKEGALNAIKCYQVPSSAFLCWRSLTMIQTLLSTPLHLAKHLEMTASLPKSWSAEKERSSLSCMKSFVSAAEKVKYHKTWGMQTSSHCTRTKAIGVTAITTVASPSKFQVYILYI